MKKLTDPLILASILLVFAVVPAVSHHGPTGDIVLDAAQDKKAAVTFPHELHTEVVESCDTCHHTFEGLTPETDADVEACSSCHLDPEEADTPSMREMSLKKNPFHVGCVDCHKAEDKGPTKCDDCHPKE